ncbi:methyl-accepting chemotaxis protein [Bacillus sp. ISL-4]|uniref:methyl-accepting chemotaxis protein n=1 Tax=Bacillus sp. ISL-4 TaxID=2819125 RepID=UPI001BEC5346|nr:methyl-accepting chemotaxis protein [Bacillus sp. ISL-4]MBT2664494.1 methyl-accepting chemotaxis protein [Bacillus sp. ISL-4]MBT2673795.1 methyl-accepting chemotaxis protein [Streptomyces sp. ISL-14]
MRFSKLNPKKSLLAKLFLFYIIPFVLFAGAMGLCFSYITNKMINENVLPQFDERLSENAHSLAASLNPTLINKASVRGEEIKRELDAFAKDKKGISYVYVLKRENDVDMIVALNGSEDYMVESPFTPEQAKSINGNEDVLSEVYKDKWGTHKSYFTAIKGTDAIVGIDMDTKFIDELKSTMIFYNILFLASAVILGVLCAVVIGKKISGPVNELVGYTNKMAKGDLSKSIPVGRQDEIGDLSNGFEDMRLSLAHIIQNVREHAQTMNQTTVSIQQSFEEMVESYGQIVTGTTEEAKASEERAHHIDRISNMISDLTETIRLMNEQTNEMNEFTLHTNTLAEQGSKQVQDVTSQMDKIMENGQANKANLVSLEEDVVKINEVIGLIRVIASQTNLLSLNASIEAARAGDAGRGFAVVAQEVQKLAVQTDESIDIISESIMRINEQTAKVIQNNDESFQDILNGVSLVENNGEIFNKIFESVEKLLKGTEQLAAHSKKINESSDESLASIQEIAAISEEGVATTEQISAAAIQQSTIMTGLKEQNQDLANESATLEEMVEKFITEK